MLRLARPSLDKNGLSFLRRYALGRIVGCGVAACLRLALLLLLCIGTIPAFAQSTVLITNISGVVSAQTPGGGARVLTGNAEVQAGDTITTQNESFARVRFPDGTEAALRPNSTLRIDSIRYDQDAPQGDSLVMSLFKGGLRAVTGFIGKRGNPDAHKLHTATATIGIRGTDYVARLCEADCGQENVSGQAAARRAVVPPIIARVANLQGTASADPKLGELRQLSVGSALYVGETVQTGPQTFAVLVFLDESKVTLQSDTRFELDRFRYDVAQPSNGEIIWKLLKGSLRAATGLIGKARPERVRMTTPNATIGIRGTGWDVVCVAACADPGSPPTTEPGGDGMYLSTWEGTVEITTPQGVRLLVPNGTVGLLSPDGTVRLLPAMPTFMRDNPSPRPDSLPTDMRQLFGEGQPNQSDEGLYVLVKDGKVLLEQQGRTVALDRGESGFSGRDSVFRLQFTPSFLQRDVFLGAPKFDPQMCRPG